MLKTGRKIVNVKEMENNYMSLFDFLGKPAGGELGLEVCKEAMRQNIKMEHREVSTKNYTGKVVIYPEEFLKEYFGR